MALEVLESGLEVYNDELVVVEHDAANELAADELGLSKVMKLSSIARLCHAGEDSKARKAGPYFVAVEPNSFGLPSLETCPGKTAFCVSDCYAIQSEKRSATAKALQRNWDILLDAGTVGKMTDRLIHSIGRYKLEADKLGVDPAKRRFRWHWSGDFYDLDYAEAVRNATETNQPRPDDPGIKFHVYTRTFNLDTNVLPVLSGLPNLDLFASVDRDNVDNAALTVNNLPDVRVAYLVEYADEAERLRQRLGRPIGFRMLNCPENMRAEDGERKLALMGARGGACSVCTYCIDKQNTWDVVFVKTGLESADQYSLHFDENVPGRMPDVQKNRVPVTISAKPNYKTISPAQHGLFDDEFFPNH